jgi:hypothetical protein
MKMYRFGILVAMVITVVGCKEKPKSSVVEIPTQAPVVEGEKEEVEEVKKPEEVKKEKLVLSPEKRAAKIGFARYLPAETEMMLSVYDAKGSFEKMKALKAIGIIEERRAMYEERMRLENNQMLEEEMEFEIDDEAGEVSEPGVEFEEDPEDLPEGAPEQDTAGDNTWTLLGQEVTVAFGKGAGAQMGNLLEINDRMTYFQASAFGKAVQVMLQSGDMEEFRDKFSGNFQEESFERFVKDPKSGVSLLDKAVMPPMYIAFRAKEDELPQANQMISSSMGFFALFGEMVAPVEFEAGGGKFVGYKLLGEKIAEMMKGSPQSMEGKMDEESMDALLLAISKKNMIFATGTIGEYVVLMIGGDEAALQLTGDFKDSLGSSDKMSFVDEFSDKPFYTVSFGDHKTLETLMSKAVGLGSYVLGFREGIAGGENMRDIEELLQLFAEREKALLAMTSASAFGMVAYADEGLKIDSFGGYDRGYVDWVTPARLAHLGESPDQLLFFNYPSNAAYDKEMTEYFELLAETAYAMATKFSKLEIDDPQMIQMKGYFEMFDKDMREDVLGMYQALVGDMKDGLGSETAIVLDMKGAMPALPGVPQEIVDKGKAPRLSMVSPVRDRAKLASAWKKMNVHSTGLLGKVGEIFDKKIPMQKPIKMENHGVATWFISIPFMQDDFMPSVTLNDQWFVASSSKTQAIDLIEKAKAGGASGRGMKFKVNFKVLSEYADEMFKLVDENIEAVLEDEDKISKFTEEKKSYQEMIDALRDFDSMSWDVSKEDGQVRSRIYVKMK